MEIESKYYIIMANFLIQMLANKFYIIFDYTHNKCNNK
jgi:hypothetical protein